MPPALCLLQFAGSGRVAANDQSVTGPQQRHDPTTRASSYVLLAPCYAAAHGVLTFGCLHSHSAEDDPNTLLLEAAASLSAEEVEAILSGRAL